MGRKHFYRISQHSSHPRGKTKRRKNFMGYTDGGCERIPKGRGLKREESYDEKKGGGRRIRRKKKIFPEKEVGEKQDEMPDIFR